MSRSLPRGLTVKRVLDAAERQMFGTDDPGFCLTCGAEACGVEPDARRYRCASCGARDVYGAAEIALTILPL